MRYVELLSLLRGTGVFDSSLLLAGRKDAAGIRRQLDRWVKTGRVVMLRRGVYMIPPPYVPQSPHPFTLANALRRASYVSLQSALAYHGMIPEYTPVVTSVTTNRPEILQTPVGSFSFRHLKQGMFRGYSETEVAPGSRCWLATPEKALVDLLYLTSGCDDAGYLKELRLEPGPLDRRRFHEEGEHCDSTKVRRALRCLEQMWDHMNEGDTL